MALAMCMLAGCNRGEAYDAGGAFDPVRFFAGHSHGDATLRTITGSARRVVVDSVGVSDGRGGLELSQTIREQGQPLRVRRWTIGPRGPARWAGTLTDAVGAATVERTAHDLTIRYRMRKGATVEQHLQQMPGGDVVNHVSITRFGVRLATLDEQIRKVGA